MNPNSLEVETPSNSGLLLKDASIHAEGTILEGDYVRAQYLHIKPRPLFAVLGLLILIMVVVVFLFMPNWILAGALAYLILWAGFLIPWFAKKNYRQYKAISEPMTLEVREDGIFFKRKNGEGLLPWMDIVKWRQNKSLFLLYPANNLFHLVPKHFFSNSERFDDLAKVLVAKLEKSK